MTADCVGGVWTYAADLCRGLAKAGVRTTLAVLGPSPTPAHREQAAGAPGLAIVDTGLPLDWLAADAEAVLEAGRAVAALARRAGADLVHLNSPALAAGGAFERPVVGACHSCLATWWRAVKPGPLPDDFRWRTALLADGYRACSALIAPSAAFARATADGYEGASPTVAYNGRRREGVESDGHRSAAFITAGRLWDEGKNFAVLDEAAGMISAPVLAAGPLVGPQGQSVTPRHVRPLGVLGAAALAGQMRHAPAFVSLALYEPFGLAVLEAAQAGCALLLSDIPAFRELWDGAAVFVDPRSAQAAAAAMRRLIRNGTQAARLGRAARARSARYSVEAMTQATLAAYAQAAASSPAEAAA